MTFRGFNIRKDKKHVVSTVAESGSSLTDDLWQKTEGYRQKALASGFVQGIKRGNLLPEKFCGYMIQDAVYCDASYTSVCIAATKATDSVVKRFLEDKEKSYEEYKTEYLKTWHIKDPAGIDLDESCQAYISHILKVANDDDPIYSIVAMLPCVTLWPWIGTQLKVDEKSDFGVYTESAMVAFNPVTDTEYASIVNAAYEKDLVDKDRATEIYTVSMKGEADFFNSVNAI